MYNDIVLYMYDLVIAVFGCDTIPKYRDQIEKINSTYGKYLPENVCIRFFLGEEEVLTGSLYIHLPGVNNDYLSASYKQYLGIKYIHDNIPTKFVLCCGSDTYLNVYKLHKYIMKFQYLDNLYIGGHGCHRDIGNKCLYYHSGGPGFVLSHTCIHKMYPFLDTFMETWINVCNKYDLKHLMTACDVGISYLINYHEINATYVLTNDLSFLHCNYKGIPCHINHVVMKDICSCHSMSLNDFDVFTKILVDNNFFIEN